MSRLREGRANTARGAAQRETVGRVHGGARGPHGAGRSGFYAHTVVARMSASLSIRQRSLRDLIEARGCWPHSHWMDAPPMSPRRHPVPDQAGRPEARVKPTPGSQLALFEHGFITDRDGEMPNWRPTIAATPGTSSTVWG